MNLVCECKTPGGSARVKSFDVKIKLMGLVNPDYRYPDRAKPQPSGVFGHEVRHIDKMADALKKVLERDFSTTFKKLITEQSQTDIWPYDNVRQCSNQQKTQENKMAGLLKKAAETEGGFSDATEKLTEAMGYPVTRREYTPPKGSGAASDVKEPPPGLDELIKDKWICKGINRGIKKGDIGGYKDPGLT